MKIFFITVLVLTTQTPGLGWLQWTHSFKNKEDCLQKIREDYDQIEAAVAIHLQQHFVDVHEMRCLTVKQAIDFNTALGH